MSLTHAVLPPRRTRYRSMVACKNHFNGDDFDFFPQMTDIYYYTIIVVDSSILYYIVAYICGFFKTETTTNK